MTDPIADMLIRIKNGYLAHKDTVIVPYSRIKKELANVLVKENYVKNVKVDESPVKRSITISLSYDKKTPKLTDIERVSKPGVRMYTSKKMIPVVFGGMGLVILSTPGGVMSGKEAKKKGLGGEIICKVW